MKDNVENEYISKLRKVTTTLFKDDKVKIILFGSRARGDNYSSSDVDIGIIPLGSIDKGKTVLLKEKVENMNIPYKVEVVNFSEVSEEFKKDAMKGAVVWKE